MAAAVYILCALTSIACTALLLRGYAKSRVRLLLWSGLGFAGFAVNNIFLFLDLVLYPSISLAIMRNFAAFVGLLLLLYGLIWDIRDRTGGRSGGPGA
ncbi:MAG TPA: DUF5985 family protein [Candidatus Nanopelagicales bacterium]|nr:DUF5985 family protein [Candidatus Nanopelagicales bacterium]